MLLVLTAEEVAKHCQGSGSLWITIGKQVFDVTTWADKAVCFLLAVAFGNAKNLSCDFFADGLTNRM